jgi:hypothetical protein
MAKEFPGSKPIAAVGDPPRNENDGNGGGEAPPNGQQEICEQAEHREDRPEDFAFHEEIVGLTAQMRKWNGLERTQRL